MSIKQRNGVWHCHFFTPSGKRIRKSLGTKDKKQAQELYDKLRAESWRTEQLDELPQRTFEECCIRWIREKENKKTLDDDKTKIEYFLTKFSGRAISSITADEIYESVSCMENRKHRQIWEAKKEAAIKKGIAPTK